MRKKKNMKIISCENVHEDILYIDLEYSIQFCCVHKNVSEDTIAKINSCEKKLVYSIKLVSMVSYLN